MNGSIPELEHTESSPNRLALGVALATFAAIVWVGAFVLFDGISQKDPWVAHTVWRERLLLGASAMIAFVFSGVILWYRLLPGRPLSTFIIAVIFASLVLPSTSTSNRRQREMVSQNRFHGFADSTIQYMAFCGPLIVGCIVASNRKRKEIREHKLHA